jgi:hypothetical protein
MKLDTNIKVTFNPKGKVCKINTITERAASPAHKLRCIDLSVMRLRQFLYRQEEIFDILFFRVTINP